MKTFSLEGTPNEGLTGNLGGYRFVKGVLQLPDEDAEAAARILNRYYGAEISEDNLTVAIWGPTNNAWQEHARRVARNVFPGHSVTVRNAEAFQGQTDAELKLTAGVVVVTGATQVIEGYLNSGFNADHIRQIPADPNVPDPGHAEPGATPTTSTETQAAPGTKDRDAADTVPPDVDTATGEPVQTDERDSDDLDAPDPEVVARFVGMGVRAARAMLKDSDMDAVFTPRFLQACLDGEEALEHPRKDKLVKLRDRLKKTEG